MSLPLPTTVDDPKVQQALDAIAGRFPIQASDLGGTKWVAPTLLNSYANYTPTPGVFSKASYRKAPDGKVQIRGLVQHAGALGAQVCIFQLPAGFRPSLQEIFSGEGNLNAGGFVGSIRIDVKANGEVNIPGTVASSIDYVSLSEISFYPE